MVAAVNPEPAKPRIGLAVTLLGAALVTTALGIWQVRRNAEKQAWIEAMHARLAEPPVEVATALADPEAFAFRRVSAEGELRTEQSVLLDHQSRGVHEGAHLLTPLALTGRAKLLLVDRGFLSLYEAEEFLRGDGAGSKPRTRVEGVLRPLVVEPLPATDEPPPGRLLHWNRIHVAALERQLGESLEPALLVRAPEPGIESPIAELPEPASRVDHVQYAITWFAIAAIAVAIAVRELWRAGSTQ
jgi:surfeit locus 1 family protein